MLAEARRISNHKGHKEHKEEGGCALRATEEVMKHKKGRPKAAEVPQFVRGGAVRS